ncbi:MAG TPA: TIM barrel protein [Lacisediminihabitans sp.]|uniref:TIM barrel protein n=1 Tax=Lacisediminihabitans sp. TaxID=2787631 RepID=UPI002ED83517
MTAIAANLVWLFAEFGDDLPARIRAARRHGIEAVEMWGWRDQDLLAIGRALEETGVSLLTMTVDPQLQLTDPATHDEWLAAVRESLEVAVRLDAQNVVVVAGDARPGVSRDEQRAALVDVLGRAAGLAEATPVTLLLENLNDRVDHVGTFLRAAGETLDVVREVGAPRLRLLLDVYHSLVAGEDIARAIAGHADLIGHVQLAESPGRHEPGTGSTDWGGVIRLLRAAGYRGRFGLEYRPTVDTVSSLAEIERVVAAVDAPAGPRG